MRKTKIRIILSFVVAAFFCCFYTNVKVNAAIETENESGTDEEKIQEGVFIGGVYVGGETREKAISIYSEVFNTRTSGYLTLIAGKEIVEIQLDDIEYSYDIDGAITKAINYGSQGNILKRYKETEYLKSGGNLHIPVEATANEEKIKSAIESGISVFTSESTDASITRENNRFVITPEKNGIIVDIDKTFEDSLTAIREGNSLKVDIIREEIKPRILARDLETITDVLGEYDTGYAGASGRMQNVENAAGFLNGQVLYPGEQLSFYDLINPYTLENGYSYAGEYNNGKVVQGIGGGVCQVSTTFYNAVLLAELDVVERHCHGLTVAYVPLSQDAAVAEGYLDFIISNNYETPIYIETECHDSRLYFRIYGKETRPDNRRIEYESILLSTIAPPAPVEAENPALKPGERRVTQSAMKGYTAELWKHIYIDGELTESIKINSSNYSAAPEYIDIGPKEEEKKPEVVDPSTDAPTTEPPASTEAGE